LVCTSKLFAVWKALKAVRDLPLWLTDTPSHSHTQH
jgi:hypothetical protein